VGQKGISLNTGTEKGLVWILGQKKS